MWDGTEWPAEVKPPRFTLVLNHPGALKRMLRNRSTDLSIGEAYIYNDFDIQGEIQAVYPVVEYLANQAWSLTDKLQIAWDFIQLPLERQTQDGISRAAKVSGQAHSIERDQQVISYHYDVSNDFFALWQDSYMVYSCAYFDDPSENLDSAQERKLDYLCRKLRLQPGERLLDIGCGWGGLVIYAAENYDVNVLGITLSQPQAELANERIRSAGLEGLCRVEVLDYRELDDLSGFDKLVSVGMFEHVGETLLPVYFRQAWKLLRYGGVFLNHGIALCVNATGDRKATFKERSFSDEYVFPDGELVPIDTTLRHAREAGFEVRDVESLREHYALTLRHWVNNLEAHHEQALQYVDETTYRIWRLFMSGSEYGFRTGRINVFQSLLLKCENGENNLPLTRADWYIDG
jgi:cyclopropane-fatty-acyl-phospholipid synthase